MKRLTRKDQLRIAMALKARLDCLRIKPETIRGHKVEDDFLHGVQAALAIAKIEMPPAFVIYHMTARSILTIQYHDRQRVH
jgi:hypothetical protein